MTSMDGAAQPNGEGNEPRGAAEPESGREPPTPTRQQLASWTHAWAAAATETYHVIGSIWDAEFPASSMGRRDAMTMVLVDAARNVLRGTEALLGDDHPVVTRFTSAHPSLKSVRDYLEHFDDYIKGAGLRQRVDGKWRGDPLNLETAGLDIATSRSGPVAGHVVTLRLIERGANGQPTPKEYDMPTRTIAAAARELARDMMEVMGLLDQRHVDRCEICSDPQKL